MRKLIAVGVLVGALLAGAVPATAQVPQIGIGDPLTLAASGVLIPFITAGGAVSLLEIASPVGENPNLHMQFYDANCIKEGPSVGMPLTTNDIAFQQVVSGGGIVGPPYSDIPNGLVAVSAVGQDGFTNAPLESPIHSRMYVFNPENGSSRVLEPIILDTAELPGLFNTWSPMRTAATFFAPQVTATVQTRLILICPTSDIQGADVAYFGSGAGPFSDTGFPVINTPFPGRPPGQHVLRARIYNADERFLRNVLNIPCTCFTEGDVATLVDPVYLSAEAVFGTYTEIEETPPGSSFTGYRETFTVNSPLNHFFGRLSNGNRDSIQGALCDGNQPSCR